MKKQKFLRILLSVLTIALVLTLVSVVAFAAEEEVSRLTVDGETLTFEEAWESAVASNSTTFTIDITAPVTVDTPLTHNSSKTIVIQFNAGTLSSSLENGALITMTSGAKLHIKGDLSSQNADITTKGASLVNAPAKTALTLSNTELNLGTGAITLGNTAKASFTVNGINLVMADIDTSVATYCTPLVNNLPSGKYVYSASTVARGDYTSNHAFINRTNSTAAECVLYTNKVTDGVASLTLTEIIEDMGQNALQAKGGVALLLKDVTTSYRLSYTASSNAGKTLVFDLNGFLFNNSNTTTFTPPSADNGHTSVFGCRQNHISVISSRSGGELRAVNGALFVNRIKGGNIRLGGFDYVGNEAQIGQNLSVDALYLYSLSTGNAYAGNPVNITLNGGNYTFGATDGPILVPSKNMAALSTHLTIKGGADITLTEGAGIATYLMANTTAHTISIENATLRNAKGFVADGNAGTYGVTVGTGVRFVNSDALINANKDGFVDANVTVPSSQTVNNNTYRFALLKENNSENSTYKTVYTGGATLLANYTLTIAIDFNIYIPVSDEITKICDIDTNNYEVITNDGVSYWKVSFADMAPKDAYKSHQLTFTVEADANNSLQVERYVSLIGYAKAALALEDDAALKQLVLSTLDYINKTNVYFGGTSVSTIEAILEQNNFSAYVWEAKNVVELGEYKNILGACLDLNNTPGFVFYVRKDYEGTVVVNGVTYDSFTDATVDGVEMKYIVVEVNAHRMAENLTVVAGEDTLTYNLDTYIHGKAQSEPYAHALYGYVMSAKAYVGN